MTASERQIENTQLVLYCALQLLQVITHKYIAPSVVCLLEEGLCKQIKVDQIIRQSTELISRIWRKHFIITTIQDFLQLK